MRSVFSNAALKRRSGFTLVEVLVASSVMVIVITVAFGSFFAVVRTISAVAARSGPERDKAAFAMRVVRDIGNIHQSTLKPVDKDATVVSFYGSSERLCFIVPDDGSVTGVLELGYEHDAEGNAVIRTDRWSDHDVRRGGRVEAVEPAGHRLEFDYYDGSQWRQEWDPVRMGRFPSAIRVTLTPQRSEDVKPVPSYRRVIVPGYARGTMVIMPDDTEDEHATS